MAGNRLTPRKILGSNTFRIELCNDSFQFNILPGYMYTTGCINIIYLCTRKILLSDHCIFNSFTPFIVFYKSFKALFQSINKTRYRKSGQWPSRKSRGRLATENVSFLLPIDIFTAKKVPIYNYLQLSRQLYQLTL